ncbi:Fic/DOC family N-terminal domain-containing protein [Verticiella sp. GG226]|uniref:Fic/DOC family N-terminal domain-containing protein n=1 Tax=Verticiella alkaliphila TaxID=2779529 RepID=UPI00273A025B|nr:Fic/DOC family N-terminal domain-containing protein [Verticiella sp. GG226]
MLINTLPLLEAKDSSEIENIVTTTDQQFQYAQGGDNADPATKEALRYRVSCWPTGSAFCTTRPIWIR